MALYRSSFFPNLLISISVLVMLLCSSTVMGICTCRNGTDVFSVKANPSGTQGIFTTADAACSNAASKCLQVNCLSGQVCAQAPNCGSQNRAVTRISDSFGIRFQCRVTCTGVKAQCVGFYSNGGSSRGAPSPIENDRLLLSDRQESGVIIPIFIPPTPPPTTPRPSAATPPGQANGDPHLKGFDGSRFDFHGEHGKHYLLFGRSNGDSLVSRIRATQERSSKTLKRQTYFDGFGLKLRHCSHRVSLSLVPHKESSRHWRSQVMINGQEIVRSQNLGCVDVQIGTGSRTVTMTTAEAKYTFTSKLRRKEMKRHIDVHVNLLRNPQKSDTYFGVLGFTLNKVAGHDVHPDLDVTSREKVQLETTLRSRFQVESLFSSYKEESTDLLYMVRMVNEADHALIPLQLSAVVISN